MKLNYLQLWTIVASIFLIFLASIFFFLGDKINNLEKMNFITDRIDSIFINTYNHPSSNPMAVQSFQPVNNELISKDTVVEKKVEEQNKPASITNLRAEKNKPPTQWRLRNGDYPNITEDQEFDRQSNYSLSNSEIQAILAGNKLEEKPEKAIAANNLTQTSRPVAGTKAFNDYIQKNRRSLTDEDCANRHGNVILVFKVDNGGHPVDIAVFRSLCQAADKEAVRLLQNGPNWTASGDNFARCEVTF